MTAAAAIPSLLETYSQYFKIDIAHTPAQRRQVYGVRYRVFAEEFGFEKAEEFPDQLEFDEYDTHSVHCLITHKPSGQAAGCIRIVPTFGNDVRDPLPLERFCSACLDIDYIKALNLPRESICEISRLAVDGNFRQRAGEKKTPMGSINYATKSEEERRTFPLIAVSSFLAALAIAKIIGRPNGFMMTEPFLPQLLARSGILVEKIGRETDYHGIRAPYFITAEQAEAGLTPDLKELYDVIYNQFEHDPILKSEFTA